MAQNCVSSMKNLTIILRRAPSLFTCTVIHPKNLHTSPVNYDKFDDNSRWNKRDRKRGFLDYNDIVYEPTKEGEDPRPAEICHQKDYIPISAKKFWYLSVLVRGLSIDEAIDQCTFNNQAASKVVKDVLLEAQELAIQRFNVEFKSNLWVADSFVQNHFFEKGLWRRARGKPNTVKYRFCTYFVRLREGQPPEHYYPPPKTGYEQLEEYIQEQRMRRVLYGL